MTILSCDHLTIGYEGHAVLSNIHFQVASGDYLAVVGENGSGKSTLMKTILGLQKPISGEVQLGDGLRRTEIGYLPQQTAIQKDFPATVWEVILSGCQARAGHRPFYNREEKKLARGAMERMNLQPLENRCYRNLSGGQQQRVLLARALCATRKLLVLDEPVSGLDPRAAADMYTIIRELNQRDGITILMISHDLEDALRDASHILHVGQEVFFGTKEAWLDSPMAGRLRAAKGGEGK